MLESTALTLPALPSQSVKTVQTFLNDSYRPEKSDVSKDEREGPKVLPSPPSSPVKTVPPYLSKKESSLDAYDPTLRYKEEMQDILDLINNSLSYDDQNVYDMKEKDLQGAAKSIYSTSHDIASSIPSRVSQRQNSHRGDHHFVPSLKLVNEETASPASSSGASFHGTNPVEASAEKRSSSNGSDSVENSDIDEPAGDGAKFSDKIILPRDQSAASPSDLLSSPAKLGAVINSHADKEKANNGEFFNTNRPTHRSTHKVELMSPTNASKLKVVKERENYDHKGSAIASEPVHARRVSFASDPSHLTNVDVKETENICQNSAIPEPRIIPQNITLIRTANFPVDPKSTFIRDEDGRPLNPASRDQAGLSKSQSGDQPKTCPTDPSSNSSGQGRGSSSNNADQNKESGGPHQRPSNAGGGADRGYDNYGMDRDGNDNDPQGHPKPRPSILMASPLRPVFIEMDKLRYRRYYQWHWHEITRWFHQEENYDELANDFGSPHSPILSFEAVTHLSKQLENGVIMLDVGGMRHLNDLMEYVVDQWLSQGLCSDTESNGLRDVLMLFRKHVAEKYTKSEIKALSYHMYSHALLQLLGEQDLDPLEFMAEESRGRRGSNADDVFRTRQERFQSVVEEPAQLKGIRQRTVSIISRHQCDTEVCTTPRQFTPWLYLLPQHHFHSRLNERLPPSTETVSIMAAVVRQLQRPLLALIRLSDAMYTEGATEVYKFPLRFLFVYLVPFGWPVQPEEVGRCFGAMMVDREFRRRAFEARYREELLLGVTSFLKRSVIVPINKYSTKESLGGMIERVLDFKHKIETKEQADKRRRVSQSHRPSGAADLTSELSFGFYSRKVSKVDEPMQLPKSTTSRHTSIAQAVTKLPSLPESQPSDTIPPKVTPSGAVDLQALVQEQFKEKSSKKRNFVSSCVGGMPFGTLLSDLYGWTQRVVSDWVDAFRPSESLSIVLMGSFFVYFAVLAPSITFGALLKTQVNDKMAVALCIVSSGVFQLLFALFGGQPLSIVGHTGPLFIVETSTAAFAKGMQMDAVSMRFWVGIYTSILGLFIQCFNGIRVIQFIRGSTTEIFNAFIAMFFILKALFTMLKPIPFRWYMANSIRSSNASCKWSPHYAFETSSGQYFCVGDWIYYSQQTTGLLIAFIMLFICLFLVSIKRGRFLRRQARVILGSLNVPISIIVVTVISLTIFRVYELPTLAIPPTVDPAGWIAIPNWEETFRPEIISTGKFHGFCIVSAICLTILIFTETSMASATMAKPDRKIQKPPLFGLDQFLVGVIFPIISGCLGWPFVSAAIVRANSHQMAMFKMDYNTPPGVPPRMNGCVEQRLSGSLVGLVTALSVFLGPILSLIPVHAMYGMFLYMGIMGLRDLLMKHRFIALLKRKCHWKDYDYLRGLPRWQLAAFVAICWFFCFIMVTLNIISEFLKSAAWAALIFPLFVVLYMLTRALVLPRIEWIAKYLEIMDKKTKIALKPPKKNVLELSLTSLSEVAALPPNFPGPDGTIQPRPEDLAAAAKVHRESVMLAQDLMALRRMSQSAGKTVDGLSVHSDSSSDHPQDSDDEHRYAVKNIDNPYPHA